jgi:hypothetical protein
MAVAKWFKVIYKKTIKMKKGLPPWQAISFIDIALHRL